jgi:hypothetical protein
MPIKLTDLIARVHLRWRRKAVRRAMLEVRRWNEGKLDDFNRRLAPAQQELSPAISWLLNILSRQSFLAVPFAKCHTQDFIAIIISQEYTRVLGELSWRPILLGCG